VYIESIAPSIPGDYRERSTPL